MSEHGSEDKVLKFVYNMVHDEAIEFQLSFYE